MSGTSSLAAATTPAVSTSASATLASAVSTTLANAVSTPPTAAVLPNSSQDPQPAPGTNAGAIAGAAVGCLMVGLLLGFAIAFFWFRRKAQLHRDSERPIEERKASSAVARAPAEGTLQLGKFLLESNPNTEIASELRSLDTLIQQHVENNYHLGPVQTDPRALAVSLMQLGIGNGGGLAAETIAQLALEPTSRHVALRHVISQALFTSIDVSARSELSMLPAPLAAFLRSIPQWESGERNTKVSSLALNQWRTLSAFLLHPARSQRTPLPISKAAVAPQAAALAHALHTFLGYFVRGNKESNSQQQGHLEAVIVETTKFGYVLLSQPSEWRFVHAPSPNQQSQQTGALFAVVCPGLVKVAGKDGTPYPMPQEVVAPSTVPI
ncbi:hypothetical protein N657DRAFT_691971 [Parathielavia appendiculata]|uniref:Uncharacterized protein n=1 Tax=Parathielavia appendiculata TaxID=2587402 RepID=A0AAN6TWH2_9PEZI|nr:hypothetical protein N657DRAFT_691971 [Parathielavia appendiculata]